MCTLLQRWFYGQEKRKNEHDSNVGQNVNFYYLPLHYMSKLKPPSATALVSTEGREDGQLFAL